MPTDRAYVNLFNIDSTNIRRVFEAKLTQISCFSPSRPPEGCFQYYTGTEGRITSFNFGSNTQHLANQNYNICIRKEPGFCCVKYRVCDDENSFTLDQNQKAITIDESCSNDYIAIEGSSSTCGLNDVTNRYCGSFLADTNGARANLEICGKSITMVHGCSELRTLIFF